jgi:N utilization substance protein B
MGNRRKARELALQVLYQIDLSHTAPTVAFDLFCEHFEGNKKARPYALDLVMGVTERATDINAMIAGHAENWRPERMSVIDRNILRIALYELCFRQDVPAVVAINEAVEVAKRFSNEESAAFVNGMLDAVRKTVAASRIVPSDTVNDAEN